MVGATLAVALLVVDLLVDALLTLALPAIVSPMVALLVYSANLDRLANALEAPVRLAGAKRG